MLKPTKILDRGSANPRLQCSECGRWMRLNFLRFAIDEARIEELRRPFTCVDNQDWDYILGALGDGGRDRFWKAVLTEMREALGSHKPDERTNNHQ